MGVDLRIYLVSPMGADRWWSNTNIALERDRNLWQQIADSKCEDIVPNFIEVYTYGADGNTKFVLDQNPYGDRITTAVARRLGALLREHSGYEYNRRVGDLLMSLSDNAQVVLYWH